jgi:hypothetical protein
MTEFFSADFAIMIKALIELVPHLLKDLYATYQKEPFKVPWDNILVLLDSTSVSLNISKLAYYMASCYLCDDKLCTIRVTSRRLLLRMSLAIYIFDLSTSEV